MTSPTASNQSDLHIIGLNTSSAATRIERGSHVTSEYVERDATDQSYPFRNVFFARGPWTASIDNPFSFARAHDVGITIALVHLGQEFRELFDSLSLSAMRESSARYTHLRSRQLRYFVGRMQERLRDVGVGHFDIESAEVNFTTAGAPSTTWIADRQAYRGLHVDNWGRRRFALARRAEEGLRIGFNLGTVARHLVLLPWSLSRCLNVCRDDGHSDLVSLGENLRGNLSQFVEMFLERYHKSLIPYRIRIEPGEAYIAPTLNIIHDGLPPEASDDRNVQVSSHNLHLPQEEITAAGPLGLLILQATPFCNIRCSYCYLDNRDVRLRMSMDTIRKTMARVLESRATANHLSISWHAGEPTTLGPRFYEEAFKAIEEVVRGTIEIRHSMQTNAIGINKAWCDLFRSYQVNVGVSIDGPQAINDRRRITVNGKGTHHAVMKAINIMRDERIPFSTISVITDEAIRDPDGWVDFMLSLGSSDLAFNIEEIEGINRKSSLAGSDDAYRAFLERVYVRARDANVAVREFRTITERLEMLRMGPNGLATPMRHITVGQNGDFTLFSPELLNAPERRFVFGNVYDSSFEEALMSASFKSVNREIQTGLQKCADACEYYGLCGGGAPSNKYFETGSFASTETLYCRLAVQAVADVVLAHDESAS